MVSVMSPKVQWILTSDVALLMEDGRFPSFAESNGKHSKSKYLGMICTTYYKNPPCQNVIYLVLFFLN